MNGGPPERQSDPGLCWVLLTTGNRPDELSAAVSSLVGESSEIIVVHNGIEGDVEVPNGRVVSVGENLGVPGGRDLGVSETRSPIIGFLDDDARLLTTDAVRRISRAFERDPELGAISFRIVDEQGVSSRRHIPRIGSASAERSGPVVSFLGGACAIRRSAYEAAGGYWTELFYAHEELELAWRLHDAGFGVVYAPEIEVEHPHTPISRHPDGWRLTGRNRVLIARRTLPWPVALLHVLSWLVVGLLRTPDARCRRAYLAGWRSGWSGSVDRRPIRWRTVGRLCRLGRPPVI
jgi:GT2 family glycosyltransferase